MSTFAKSFRDEVCRLARKEAKAAVAPIRKPAGATRSALADLKRRVAALEKETRRLSTLVATLSTQRLSASARDPLSDQKARITGKGMRSLRRRLRLSAADLGRLLHVSGPAVYAWEKRNGPLRVRQTTRAAILSIRTLGAREAKSRLQTHRKK
jgi:DNA-binding transcriptional regulator YiaG